METLETLDKYDARQFEIWIKTTLVRQYSADPYARYNAYDFRDLGIPIGESHIDAFIRLFRKLSPTAQESFRSGTELLFRHAQLGKFPVAAMADLISISGQTESYGTLTAFPAVLGAGPWGEMHRCLIYDALSVLLTFDQSLEAYEVTRGLVTSSQFADGYVFDAYLILIRARPDNWAADLGLLRQRFFRLRQTVVALADPRQDRLIAQREKEVALEPSRAVPLSEVALHLGELELMPSTAPDVLDAWLISSLFVGSDAPLRLEYSTDGMHLYLMDANDRARMACLPDLPAFEVFCIILHGV